MMRYMLMCCFNEDQWNAMPEAQRERVMREYGAWIENLDRDGRHVGSARLQSTATAATVRLRDGEPFVTDGPFAETKEQFGGYHIIECTDLEEAAAVAARIPTLAVGGVVEVREVETTS